MRRIMTFSIFESAGAEAPGLVSAAEFGRRIGLSDEKSDMLSEWWSENRPGVKIHYFPFRLGVFAGVIGPDAVAINEVAPTDRDFRLFLLLHESHHLAQHDRGPEFHDGYFGSVVAGDEMEFAKAYQMYEREANDVALEGMRELGVRISEGMVRGNEGAARMVYPMMRRDIERTGARDIFELIRKQII